MSSHRHSDGGDGPGAARVDQFRARATSPGLPAFRLAEEGTAFLIPARINGRPGIRACITNYRTTRADIGLIMARLSDITRQLSI